MIYLTIFFLKYAFLGFIYLFLFWLVRLVSIDLKDKTVPISKEEKRPKKRIGLVLEESPGLIEPIHFSVAGETTIGRSPRNNIKINDEAASYFHAKFETPL